MVLVTTFMLSEQLVADLKSAMLNRDTTAVSVLRMLQSELKNAAIAKQGELTPDDEINVIRKEVKKRTEAAVAYRQGKSEERAQSEEAEAAVLNQYLPAATDPEAVRAFLKDASSKMGTLEPRHRGELIRAAREQFGPALDGQTANQLVGELY